MKQWQIDPSRLPESIISRLPVRYNFDDRYFDDPHQGLPTQGYATWINNMIKNEKINLVTSVDFFDLKHQIQPHQQIIYSGAIDRYFNYSQGFLGWRTLDFETQSLNINDFQGGSIVNYADAEIPFTRIHEYKHLHPERKYKSDATVISHEYSRFATKNEEPYYPINTESDRKMLVGYRNLANGERNVHFGGRLGRYQYLDMHMAISSALALADEIFRLKS